MAEIVSLHRSPGGVPKTFVPEVAVTRDGLEGDGHRFYLHGGEDKALCIYAMELIEALQAEGHPIAPGTTGENVTVRGLDWRLMVPGARVRLGAVLAEVTDYSTPCKTIAGSFRDGRSTRIGQKAYPGWSRVYARVLEPGVLRVGDAVSLVADD